MHPRPPRFLFINENIGGHRTVHASFRKIFAERDDVEVEFLDGQDPGILGKILRAPIPGLARLDLDLQPLRGQLVHSWNMKRRVKKRLAAGDVDAVHLYTQNTMLGGAKLLRGIPTVITTDSTGRLNVFSIPYRKPTRFTAPLSKLNLFFERPVLKSATKVFANTKKVVDSLRSADYLLAPSQVEHLEMGIHSPYFTAPLPARDPAKRPNIVFLGTSLERKGGNLLLEIWREELKGKADLTLVTLEEVPPEAGLRVINDLTPGEERLWEILAAADIMCFPSTIDQAPNVILEAMAAGLPVIAHPNGAIPEMIAEGETGYLVDCHRRQPVAEALHRLIDDPELRAQLGQAGYHRVRERYNLRDSTEVILQELRRAAGFDTASAPEPVADAGAREESFGLHATLSPELKRQWAELGEQVSTKFASRPSYAWTWFETLGKGELALATVHRGNRLVALLPLHTRKRAGITSHRWLGHGLGTIGEALFVDKSALGSLVSGIRDAGVLLELTHTPADSPLLAELLASGDWIVDFRSDERCPVTDLPPGSRARDFRSKKTLKRLRVARDAMARDIGPVEFEVIRTPAELAARWEEIVRVTEVAREADESGKLNLLAGAYGEFGRRFLQEEAANGHLLLLGLRVDSTMVAIDVQFQSGDREEAWYTRFDPDFGKLAPGHQMIEFLADHHDDYGIYQSDQLIGQSSYKVDWQTSDYEVGTIFATPREKSWQLPVSRVIGRASEKNYRRYQEFTPKLVALAGKIRR
ncbi:GNAT family N-acetyltransferase [Corynebacterium sp. A21]|uniref:GNAT family N-acetyltransferase n=1 Tax=Corynebacterium sp. A21 TaxID=3457318 RepID=UPI003FD472D4